MPEGVKLNIIFFGASVTEQREGYYKYIKENFFFSDHCVDRYSFGGCHLDDAGFFNVCKLRDFKPDVVVFEWNTTARSKYDIDKVNYIFSQVAGMGALPIILILPHAENYKVERESEQQMISLSKNNDIALIDIRKDIISKYNLKELLRDGVHTNAIGAEIFGTIVANRISDILHESRLPITVNKANSEYFKIVSFDFCETELKIKKEILLRITLNAKMWGLCLYHEIGKFSPLVKIFVNNHFVKKISFWDPYCHYSRMHYISLLSNDDFNSIISEKLELRIGISSELPDYSVCRRDDIAFDVEKEIRAHILYGYGINLEVKEWK